MKKVIIATILGVSAVSASAVPIASADPAPAYNINARARNGNTGFEAVLFTPANPSPTGVPLNPGGAPIWNTGGNVYGTTYFNFKFNYNVADGVTTWGIDFNKDSDFADPQELATSDTAFDGQSFEYINLFLDGNGTVGVDLKNFTINGVNLGNFSNYSETDFNSLFEDSSGLFGNIEATGSFTFSGNGGSERPRLWIQLGSPQTVPTNVPDSGATLGLFAMATAGFFSLRRKNA